MNKNPRTVQERGLFSHGQSISLMNDGPKGSIAIFLATSDNENELYALMTYHELPYKDRNESQVITPSSLDSLTWVLAAIISKPLKMEPLMVHQPRGRIHLG